MVHWNFGSDRTDFSAGVEGATWHIFGGFPLGLDYGCEWDFGKNRLRLYTEGEAGMFFMGFGMGPVVEFGKGGAGWAVQSTLWANALVGIDYRVREFGSLPKESAFGLYGKWPAFGVPRRDQFIGG